MKHPTGRGAGNFLAGPSWLSSLTHSQPAPQKGKFMELFSVVDDAAITGSGLTLTPEQVSELRAILLDCEAYGNRFGGLAIPGGGAVLDYPRVMGPRRPLVLLPPRRIIT